MRSRSGRSTGRSPRRRGRPPPVDVYLFPAVVGGGLGDIEETLSAGRRLSEEGFPTWLYRPPGRPLPSSVDGPWEWPAGLRRITRLTPSAPAALTVVPAWGVSAAPARPGPLGRPGPWSREAAEVEHAYGSRSTLHVSLEEFARTLTLARENRERLREGGVAARDLTGRLRSARRAGEVDRFRVAYERFRAFDRPNVLHVFATFRKDAGFAREFPAAVQTGPLWPHRTRLPGSPSPAARRWVWYASPASAQQIAPEVIRGLSGRSPPIRLLVRTPRDWAPAQRPPWVEVVPVRFPARRWSAAFGTAELRIVTGSRTLLEALEAGGPFLYFNGVLGGGPAMRRHRPEKLQALLDAARGHLPADLRQDLADFGRGRRVAAVVRRAADRAGAWRSFPRRWFRADFPPPFDDAGSLLTAVARALGRAPRSSVEIVRRVRAGSNP
jgi:hypothetical protein